jgi:hypothetical protein
VLICGSPEDTHVHVSAKEKFEDTKSVKDMHYDGQNKKDQMTKLCVIFKIENKSDVQFIFTLNCFVGDSYHICYLLLFKYTLDTKSVKDMHYDGQNKKDQMTKLCTIKVDKSKINQTNNGCELMCFRRGSSFRSIKMAQELYIAFYKVEW